MTYWRMRRMERGEIYGWLYARIPSQMNLETLKNIYPKEEIEILVGNEIPDYWNEIDISGLRESCRTAARFLRVSYFNKMP